MSLTFRSATLADLPTIRKCADEAFRPLIPILGVEPMPLSECYLDPIRTGQIEIVERDPGRFVGFVYRFRQDDHLMVDTVSIAPSEQNLGVLVQIGISLVELARRMGVAKVRTYTNERLARNISMLRRMGFVVTGRRPGPDRVFVDLELDLAKPASAWGEGAQLAGRYRAAIAAAASASSPETGA